MKMPSRSDHHNSESFLAALNGWMGASESAYQHLRGMFDATKAWEKKPRLANKLSKGTSIKSVHLMTEPDESNIEVALRALSGALLNDGLVPKGIHHGVTKHGWAVFAVATKN